MGRPTILQRRSRPRAALAAAAAGAFLLTSAAHADDRPAITVAVQQIVNAGVLDTLREQSNVGSRIFPSIFDTLVEVDRQGDLSVGPALAESWKRIDDKTIEFTLRKGVMFHNGEEMTAEDVVFSFGPERMWGFAKAGDAPKTGQTLFTQGASQSSAAPPEVHAVARRLLPGFERMEAVDRYTVRYHNKAPDVTLEGRLTRTGMNVVSKKAFLAAPDWRTFAAAPVATGPYKVKEFKPDNVLVLEAHDAYWGGKPNAREIRFVVVPEVAGRINGLISGQYDFVTDVPPDQIKTIEASAKHDVVGGPVLNYRLTVFDKNHPQLKDPRVRRALTLAIDRKLIVDTLWSGRTSIPQGLQWEYYGPMFVKDWQAPAYDPEAARKLLKEAGYKGEPIPFRVLNNYYANQVPNAQILQEMWRAVGANVVIEMKENWQQIFAKDGSRAVRDWSNSAPFNDPVSSIVTQHCPHGQQQQVGEWSNEEFNTLCAELETSTDQARRPVVFRRMLEIIERDDPGYTVLHRTVLFYGKRKDLDWKYSPTQAMDFRATNLKISK